MTLYGIRGRARSWRRRLVEPRPIPDRGKGLPWLRAPERESDDVARERKEFGQAIKEGLEKGEKSKEAYFARVKQERAEWRKARGLDSEGRPLPYSQEHPFPPGVVAIVIVGGVLLLILLAVLL